MRQRRNERRYRVSGWTLNAILAVLLCAFWGISASGQTANARGHGKKTTTTTTPATTAAAPQDNCGALIPKPGGGYWSCTLNSGFTGNTLDSKVWAPSTTAETGFHSGPECLVDSPNNISVGGGVLTLTARKEPAPFTCNSPQGPFTTQYTGAEVATNGLFSQQYGRFEVRARMTPTTIPGLQTSFWLWPTNPTLNGPIWPQSGEIDTAEIYSDYDDRAIPYIHYNNPFDPNVTSESCMIPNVGDWNNYDLEWTPTTLTIIYNGQTCLVDNWNPLLPQVKPAPFDQPFMMVLSQVLGKPPNNFDPATTPLPASTQVQWVKVWK